uniref:Ribosome biogenesis protein NOP53 n=1 Tax=Arcella intermedia TaxID=1963864 RepID=A0A6B2L5U0_9EUKA
MARSKKLSYQLACDPFPHVQPTRLATKPKTTDSLIAKQKAKFIAMAKGKSKAKPTPTPDGTTPSEPSQPNPKPSQPKAPFFDLWDQKEEDPHQLLKSKFPGVPVEYLEPKVPIKAPEKKVPSFLPAVEVPHPGASYNPLPQAYNNLLKEALEEEKRHREEYNRVLSSLKSEQRKEWGRESDPFPAEKGDEDEEEESDGEGIRIPGKREYQPHDPHKTQSEINKAKRKKQTIRDLKLKEKQKEARKRWELIDQFQKELEEEGEVEKAKKLLKEKRKLEKMFEPRKLGSEKFEKPDVEVLLPEQLPKTLRHIRCISSDPLRDRFVSFQKRNIIESRSKKLKWSRYKPKFVEKYSYKAFSKEQELKYKDL